MSACETRIPVSKDVRREIRQVKANRDELETYDDALAALVEAYDRDN
jgi:hypothetical protein